MKKNILCLLLASSAVLVSTAFCFPPVAAGRPMPNGPATRRTSVATGLTGNIEGFAMVPSFQGTNSVTNSSNYFHFAYGLYGMPQNVSVEVVSANCDVQLTGGFDEAPNVWRITFNTSTVDHSSAEASATIVMRDAFGNMAEYVIVFPRTAWW